MSTKVGITAENYEVSESYERTRSDATTGLNKQQEDSDGLKIHGLALPFGKRSRNGVVYKKESIEKAAETLIGCSLLFNHDENNPIGHIEDVEIKEDGLYYYGDLNEEKRETESLRRGDIPHVSIQATVNETAETQKQGVVAVDEFLEMSAVTVPGFSSTDVEAEETVKIEKLMGQEMQSVAEQASFRFETGDWVQWEFAEGTATGIVRERENEPGEELSVSGASRTATEDEPVYKLEEWDDEQGELTDMVVKSESELSETSDPRETESSSEEVSKEAFEFAPVPSHVLYEDKNDALQRAKDLGLAEVHKHVMNDQEFWMAGATHEEWNMAIRDELSGSSDGQESVDDATSEEPFAGYDDFDDCVSQNQDKNDPDAYCAAIKRQVEESKKIKARKEAVEDVDTVPTEEMADIASQVLEKIDDPEFENDDCGTRTGLERANQLENQEELTEETINRMVSFFARHDGNQAIDDDVDSKWEDCGFVAWQLWGGDPGRDWAERKQEEIEEAKEEALNNVNGDDNMTEENKQEDETETTEENLTEQLEEVNESDFHGTIADMYEELGATDVAQLMDEFEFSDDPEPLVAHVADIAGMTPADLTELLESEMEGTHGDMDDDEEDEAGYMDDGDEEDDEMEESQESESSNKNEGSESESQDGDNSEMKSREELRKQVEELQEAVRKLEGTTPSKQEAANGSTTSEDSDDSGVLSDDYKNRIMR